MIKKTYLLFFLILFFLAGCSSGSRFSKEILLSNSRVNSIDNSFSALIPNYWSTFEDNLNGTILLWLVSNNFQKSILINLLNNNISDLSIISEIIKTSKKQNPDYKTSSVTEILNVDGKKSAHFILEGNKIQHVFVFQYKNKIYEVSAISKIANESNREELFHIAQSVISSIK